LNSAIFNVDGSLSKWTELAVTNQADGWLGKSHVTGKISPEGLPEFLVGKQNVWGFSIEFP
jgi:hypothetical protein